MNKSSIVVVALIALAGGFLASWYLNPSKPLELEAGLWFGEQARALPEFELIDHNRQLLNNSRLQGKWSLMFFGYTHCPDICPITLQTLGDMLRAIKDSQVREAINVIFVTLDPQRDSAEVFASYVNYFNPDMIAAGAPMEKLRILTTSLGIAHHIYKTSETDQNYGVDHSSAVVLINPAVEYAGLFSAPQDAVIMARDMSRIVEHAKF